MVVSRSSIGLTLGVLLLLGLGASIARPLAEGAEDEELTINEIMDQAHVRGRASKKALNQMVFKEVEVVADGKKRTEKVPEMQYKREVAETDLAVASIRVLDAEGNELAGEELWRRLTLGSVVLRVADGQPPAAEYLKLLAKD